MFIGTDDNGLTHSSKLYDLIALQSPIACDNQATLIFSAAMLRSNEEHIQSIAERLNLAPDDGRAQVNLQKAMARSAGDVKSLKTMKDANTKAGRVVAAGGYRVHPDGWPLDWALVRTPTSRRVTNTVS